MHLVKECGRVIRGGQDAESWLRVVWHVRYVPVGLRRPIPALGFFPTYVTEGLPPGRDRGALGILAVTPASQDLGQRGHDGVVVEPLALGEEKQVLSNVDGVPPVGDVSLSHPADGGELLPACREDGPGSGVGLPTETGDVVVPGLVSGLLRRPLELQAGGQQVAQRLAVQRSDV